MTSATREARRDGGGHGRRTRGTAGSPCSAPIGDRTLVVAMQGAGCPLAGRAASARGDRRLTRVYDFTPHDGPWWPSALEADKASSPRTPPASSPRLWDLGQTLLSRRLAGTWGPRVHPKTDGIGAWTQGVWSRGTWTTPPGDHPQDGIRQGLYEGGYFEAGVNGLAVYCGTDDFEASSADAAHLWHAQGTLYALLFRGPAGLLAATYVSEFMQPDGKGVT